MMLVLFACLFLEFDKIHMPTLFLTPGDKRRACQEGCGDCLVFLGSSALVRGVLKMLLGLRSLLNLICATEGRFPSTFTGIFTETAFFHSFPTSKTVFIQVVFANTCHSPGSSLSLARKVT